MNKLIIFSILSIPLVFISRKSIFSPKSHGFYRFISWECIAWLFASNYPYWFPEPKNTLHIISWILLSISLYLVIAGVIELKRAKKDTGKRDEKGLYRFEKTAELVTSGIFRYIRHPLYSSLIFLTWGIFLKHLTVELFIVSCLSTICMIITALIDEKGCKKYFGDQYKVYMKKTTRFIPYLI